MGDVVNVLPDYRMGTIRVIRHITKLLLRIMGKIIYNIRTGINDQH